MLKLNLFELKPVRQLKCIMLNTNYEFGFREFDDPTKRAGYLNVESMNNQFLLLYTAKYYTRVARFSDFPTLPIYHT